MDWAFREASSISNHLHGEAHAETIHCISEALRKARATSRSQAFEECAVIADEYAEAAGGSSYQVSKELNSRCIAEAIRRKGAENGSAEREKRV